MNRWFISKFLILTLLVVSVGLFLPLHSVFAGAVCSSTVSSQAELITAINCANGNGVGNDTITLTGTITMTTIHNNTLGDNGTPSITTEITINGDGNIIERSSVDIFRFFHVHASGTLHLSNATVQGGGTTGSNDGAAIYSAGNLDIDNSIFQNNDSDDDGGVLMFAISSGGTTTIDDSQFLSNVADDEGGVIYTTGTGTIVIRNSIFKSNQSITGSANGGAIRDGGADWVWTILNTEFSDNSTDEDGGAIQFQGTSIAYITNTTFSGNSASENGGAIDINGGSGGVVLTNVTFSDNTATLLADTIHFNVAVNPIALTATNVIIANASNRPHCESTGGSPSGFVSNNVVDDTSCTGSADASINLGTLVDNGGQSQTHSIDNTSSAYDAGDASVLDETVVGIDLNGDGDMSDDLATGTDQRGTGFDRVVSFGVDIGAFESQIDACASITFPTTVGTPSELVTAINCANANATADVINLSATISLEAVADTTNGNNGTPGITSDITINGNGNTIERAASISDTISFRHFYVDASGTLTLNDATLENGYTTETDGSTNWDDDGGAILSFGSLTLDNVTINNNRTSNSQTTPSGTGSGVIMITAGSTATIKNSAVTNNVVHNGTVFVQGEALIEDTTIDSNLATGGGGGIYNNNQAVIKVNRSTISNNTALFTAGGYFGFDHDQPNDPNSASLLITNSTISGNSAANGGGIYLFATGYDFVLTNNTIVNNSGSTNGGGIYMTGGVNAIFRNNIIANNSTGGDCYYSTGTIDATSNGNNLDSDGTCASIPASSTVFIQSGNIGLGSLQDNGGNIETHAIDTSSDAYEAGSNSALDESTVDEDLNGDGDTGDDLTTEFDGRGTGFPRLNDTNVDVGAYEAVDPCASLTFPTTVGTASDLVTAINCANANMTADTINLNDTITLTSINNTTDGENGLPGITSEITINGNGNTIERSASISDTISFRIFRVDASGTLTLNNVIVENGSAQDSGSETNDTNGGGLLNNGITTISNSTFNNNTASSVGSAIMNDGSGELTITSSTFTSNQAINGTLYNEWKTLIQDSTFSGNVAGSGGGVYNASVTGAEVTIIGSTFTQNSANNGGAIYIINGIGANITNSTISGNTATNGGGLYALGSTALYTLTNVTITDNDATNGAGVYLFSGSDLTSRNTIIANNTSGNDCVDGTASGTVSGNANNLDSDGSCAGLNNSVFTQSSNIGLGTLQNNGGDTETHAIDDTSDAFDAGDNTALNEGTVSVDLNGDGDTADDLATGFDQRGTGFNRVNGASVDVGAFEVEATPPDVTIGDVSIAEGDSGSTALTFTVTLSGTIPVTITLDITTADDTAEAGVDYTAVSTTLIIPPNATSVTFTVSITGDTTVEADESFFVNLSNPTNANIVDNQAIGTILNDDTATLSINDVSVTEGDVDSTNAVFIVSLSGTSALTTTVHVASADGTATAGADYNAISHTITLVPGEVSQTIIVAVYGDIKTESDETFTVTLSNPTNATLGDGVGEGTINNDDMLPPVDTNLIFNPSFNVGTGKNGWRDEGSIVSVVNNPGSILNLRFPAVVDGWFHQFRAQYPLESGLKMEASVQVSNPDAVSKMFQFMLRDSDFSNTFLCAFTIPANAPMQTYTMRFVTGTDWEIIRADMRPNVVGGNGLNIDNVNLQYRPGLSVTGKECITPAPLSKVSVNDVMVTEGNTGSSNANFTVSLNTASALTITVKVNTADVSATAGTDYTAVSTTVTFAPGQVSKTVAVAITGDIKDESNETFHVNLSNVSNATILDSQGVGTITDNDTLPPQNTNLIYNPGFTLGVNMDAGWRYEGNISGGVDGNGKMKLNFTTTVNGWLRQFRTVFPLESGLRMVAYVQVQNPDAVSKTFQLMMRDSDLSNTFLCSFIVPPNAPERNYYMRFITGTDWEIIRVDMRPMVVDAGGLLFDDVNLRYRPSLSFTEKECIPPNFSDETPTPPPTELISGTPPPDFGYALPTSREKGGKEV